MKVLTLVSKTSLLGCLFSITLLADGPKWGYEGEGDPENWGKISQDFMTCEYGKSQSPINITNAIKTNTSENIAFFYTKKLKDEINNGHSIQVNYPKGNYVTLDAKRYDLLQFHFHSPAENLINNKQYPFSIHFVHQSEEGKLLVIALLFEVGKENKILKPIWDVMPQKEGETTYPKNIALNDLFSKNPHYYRFDGSLTTPPCTEGVTWVVIKKPLEISKTQLEKFQKIMKHSNNRPIQPTNNRVIIEK